MPTITLSLSVHVLSLLKSVREPRAVGALDKSEECITNPLLPLLTWLWKTPLLLWTLADLLWRTTLDHFSGSFQLQCSENSPASRSPSRLLSTDYVQYKESGRQTATKGNSVSSDIAVWKCTFWWEWGIPAKRQCTRLCGRAVQASAGGLPQYVKRACARAHTAALLSRVSWLFLWLPQADKLPELSSIWEGITLKRKKKWGTSGVPESLIPLRMSFWVVIVYCPCCLWLPAKRVFLYILSWIAKSKPSSTVVGTQ